jgi:hypothetical protein
MKGIQLSQNYTINSSYTAMKCEYEMRRKMQQKQNTVDMLCNFLLHGVYIAETLNDSSEPFGFKLKGWSKFVNAEISTYHEIFEEIYEKHAGSGNGIPPELKLLFTFTKSGVLFFLSNKFGNAIPNFNSFEADNPDLIKKMREKAVQDTANMKKQSDIVNEEIIKDTETLKRKDLEKLELERQMLELKGRLNQPQIHPPANLPIELQNKFFNNEDDKSEISSKSSISMKSSISQKSSRSQKSSISINPDLRKIVMNTKLENELSSIDNVSKNDMDNTKISLGGEGKVKKRNIKVGRKKNKK